MKPQPRYHPGDRIGGRYLVHQALMGGMGEVYLCLDLEQNYPYALKTFQQRYLTDTQRLRRVFEQEVATWVALEKHPNIVRCFYMDTLDNQPFMVLEWVAGEKGRGSDLRGWLRRGPLALKLALEIAIDICNGLIHAQTKRPGLVHRDLKPENILMAQGGLAKITDFGLAQIVQTAGLEVTQEGVTADSRQSFVGGRGIAGTPAYMAPEQWQGEPLDERTDIYALGVILYELLTGVSPFQVAFTPTTPVTFQAWLCAMQSAHERGRIPDLPDALPSTLNHLLHICLAKVQSARPASLTDLMTQLTTVYGEHLAIAPPTRPSSNAFTVVDYNNRGITYHRLGQYAAALADYSRALALDPDFTLPYTNRGATYDKMKRYEDALANHNAAIQHDPNDSKAYNNRGITYDNLQQYATAIADYTCAIQLDPYYEEAHNNRGLAYSQLQQYDAALVDYNRAIRLNRTNPEIYVNRGITYHKLQQYDLAFEDFIQAIQLDPQNAKAHFNVGVMLGNQGKLSEALTHFEKAVQLGHPQGSQYVVQLKKMLWKSLP